MERNFPLGEKIDHKVNLNRSLGKNLFLSQGWRVQEKGSFSRWLNQQMGTQVGQSTRGGGSLSWRSVMYNIRLGCALLLSSVLAGAGVAGDWPRFRGPEGMGISADENIPVRWSDETNLKWKKDLPGEGTSSPIVVGDKVFVTCSVSGQGGGNAVTRQLMCLDRARGTVLWSREVKGTGVGRGGFGRGGFGGRGPGPGGFGRGGFGRGSSGRGPNTSGNAAHTPVSDGERIYVMFGTSGVLAYDLDGKELWKKSVGTGSNGMFGSASSPILYKDLVIVTAGYESASFYAFDKKTGEQKWKSEARNLTQSYSTPVIVKNPKGEDELLISVTYEVWSMNPNTGKLNWYCQTGVDTGAIPSLIAKDGIVYAVGGRTGSRTALKVGGKDDVSRTNVLWSERGGTYVPSPVVHQGHLYYVKQGFAYCIEAKTGKEAGRRRLSGDFYASPVLIKDKLYIVSRFDGAYVLEASPKLTQIAANKLSDDSDFSASPAVSNGQLFLRSDKALYCIAAR
jgi:outer membrane protein assembly factor BamB